MKKNFLVIGLGRFGSNVAKSLAEMNCDVLAIDVDEDCVRNISKKVPHCVIADATKMDVLVELGVNSIDHAVIAIGNNLEASILTIVNLKRLGIKNITVRCDDGSHKELFNLVGATEVLIPEEASAISLANQINSDSIMDYHVVANDYVMVKIVVGKTFKPKTLIEMDIRNNFDVNIVGIIRDNEFFIPRGTDKIMPLDIVVAAGKNNLIRKFDLFLN